MTAVIDHLYRIALLILRDFDSAEDAGQEALVRCWRDLQASAVRTDSTPR